MHVGPPSPVLQRKFRSSDLIASETETDEEWSRQTDEHAGHTDAGADVTNTPCSFWEMKDVWQIQTEEEI